MSIISGFSWTGNTGGFWALKLSANTIYCDCLKRINAIYGIVFQSLSKGIYFELEYEQDCVNKTKFTDDKTLPEEMTHTPISTLISPDKQLNVMLAVLPVQANQ